MKPQPDADITAHMQTAYYFSSTSRAPPAYSFLLKQLGALPLLRRAVAAHWHARPLRRRAQDR